MTPWLYALLAVVAFVALVVGACLLVRMIDPERQQEGGAEPELERLRRIAGK